VPPRFTALFFDLIRVLAAVICLAFVGLWVVVSSSDLQGVHEALVAEYIGAFEADYEAVVALGEREAFSEAADLAETNLERWAHIRRGDRAFFIKRRLQNLHIDALITAGQAERAHTAAKAWVDSDDRDIPALLAYGRSLESVDSADPPALEFYAELSRRYPSVEAIAQAHIHYAHQRGRTKLAQQIQERYQSEVQRRGSLFAPTAKTRGTNSDKINTMEGQQ